MVLSLRCRGPTGQITLSGLSSDMSVAEFLNLLQAQTGVAPSAAEILSGFPPKSLQIPGDHSAKLQELGLANGDTFTLRIRAAPEPAMPEPISEPPPSAPHAEQNGHAWDTDGDADLARALAASMAEIQQPSSTIQSSSHAPVPMDASGPGHTASGKAAPTSIQLADGSCVVRRIIDSDNSCLFNSVASSKHENLTSGVKTMAAGYVMEHTRSRAQELRQVIATRVSSDHLTYNEGFLGMENKAYCEWIMSPDKWGGGIELSILCSHYGCEIAAYDIRTKRCDIYGQDAGYPERVMLIYDGLHYDALAVSAFEGAPEELDVTIFSPSSRDGEMILQGAAKLVEGAHAARQFTDTANFALRCVICQIGLKGEKEAVEHAKSTGHSNFSEY